MKDQNPTTVESHVDDAVEESAESLRSSTVGGCILDGVNAMDPVVVCATDDRYIMPLAVTLYFRCTESSSWTPNQTLFAGWWGYTA